MSAKLYRVQDSEGRGPWRPGLSAMWMDDDIGDRAELPSIIEEFGLEALQAAFSRDKHHGTACRSVDALKKWFTASEMRKLDALGFRLVCIYDGEILFESPCQVVFSRGRPLNKGVSVVRWP